MIAAIVPAAGESRRMGRPKLLLPIDGVPLLGRVVRALLDGGAEPVFVIVPPSHRDESAALAAIAAGAGGTVVVPPIGTTDMRGSIELGLASLQANVDAILIAPGDTPAISEGLVRLLIERHHAVPTAILIPAKSDRRGHPILLPGDLAVEIGRLPEGAGLNALIAREEHRVVLVPVEDRRVADDMDTPEDYARWARSEG